MPTCKECPKFADDRCLAHPADWPDIPVNWIRRCVIAINERYCAQIQPHHTVLEVGVGTWSPIRDHCRTIGASWEGIDISPGSIATRLASIESLPFENDRFDFVIGNQTMEHWKEFGCPLDTGLSEAFRVCKVGGSVLLNVPLHFHGSREFVYGDVAALRRAFAPFTPDVTFTTWRRHSAPLPAAFLLPGFPPLAHAAAYNLDIQARKVVPTRTIRRRYRVRSRIVRELRDHRADYLVWKAVQKVRHYMRGGASGQHN